MSLVQTDPNQPPEVLSNNDGVFWLRADVYIDCDKDTPEQITEYAKEFGDEDSGYTPEKVHMRPYTQEENDDIGEEGWWAPDDGTDPQAVEYWWFEPAEQVKT